MLSATIAPRTPTSTIRNRPGGRLRATAMAMTQVRISWIPARSVVPGASDQSTLTVQ
jgi:hypothetical protein